MKTYKTFRPTQFDHAGICPPDNQDWLVAPVARNRDSDCLAESKAKGVNHMKKHTKIQVSPEVAEFNDAVEMADALTDYQFDNLSATMLLRGLECQGDCPNNVEHLKNAIAGLAVTKSGKR